MSDELWRQTWERGFQPLIPTQGLVLLADLLRADDPRLIQRGTTQPPPLTCCADWPVEAACPVAAALSGLDLLVGLTEEAFSVACWEADQVLGEPGAVRHFLNWWDQGDRQEVRQALLPVVEAELIRRKDSRGDPQA